MRKIEVKFPEVKGMKVNGATLDFKNGCSVVEYVEEVEFKRGDILYCEYSSHGGCNWICINDNINNRGFGRYLAILIIKGNTDTANVFKLKSASFQNVELDMIRLATDSEKQLLFDALEKEGKYWDAEVLEVKEFDRVPDDIGIYKCNELTKYNKGDGLYIGFNDNKQIISTSNGIYTVDLNDADIYSRVNCYLKPINHEDVKVGDTILCGDKTNIEDYFKISNSGWVFSCSEDTYIMDRSYNGEELFKLTPIK